MSEEKLICGCGENITCQIVNKVRGTRWMFHCENCSADVFVSGKNEAEAISAFKRATRADVKQGIDWIPITEKPPEYCPEFDTSVEILIFDDDKVHVGNYHAGKFEWWSGVYCNTDTPTSQKTITHFAYINLPEK